MFRSIQTVNIPLDTDYHIDPEYSLFDFLPGQILAGFFYASSKKITVNLYIYAYQVFIII